MPELPEVQCVVNSLARLKGKRFNSVQVVTRTLRTLVPDDLSDLLCGQLVVDVFRRGKCIVFKLERGFLLCHLGMTGKLVIDADPAKHDHVLFEFEGGVRMSYNDPRKFGFILFEMNLADNAHLSGLGIDALSDDFTADWLWKRTQGSRREVKTFLLDQKIISGLGNIYVLEVLYLCRISPMRLTGALTYSEVSQLVVEIKKILIASIAKGGSSISDYRDADNKKGDFQKSFNVYERQLDPDGHPVKWVTQSGRGTYYSPAVQM